MTVRRTFTAWAAVLVLLAGVACSGGDSAPMIAETDETPFRDAQRLKDSRPAEALANFLKVIEKRGLQNAPESHLEAGQIYLEHVKNPIFAIYHFSKYLELQPNAVQAPLVRQRIEAATLQFSAQLPLRPEDNQLRVNSATELDGYEVARALRSSPIGKSAALIAVTGYGQVDDRRRSKDAGFDAHLVKPVSQGVLASLLASP
jgi:CheY-like chemotaxis protein